MKKISSVLGGILLAGILLCGCGKKEDVITNLSYAEYAYDLQYEYFDSEKSYQFNIGAVNTLVMDVVCTQGSLDVKVVDIDNEEIYHEELLVSKQVSVSVPEDGRYIIVLTGNETSGGIHMEVMAPLESDESQE